MPKKPPLVLWGNWLKAFEHEPPEQQEAARQFMAAVKAIHALAEEAPRKGVTHYGAVCPKCSPDHSRGDTGDDREI